MSDQAVPDGIELVKDGTILCVIDGTRIRLRRPKIGEYRKLEERLDQLDDDRGAIEAERAEASKRYAAEKVESEADPAATVAEARRVLRQILRRSEDLSLGWMQEAFDMLADQPLPPFDELPAFFFDPNLTRDLRKHWRTAPLARGVG